MLGYPLSSTANLSFRALCILKECMLKRTNHHAANLWASNGMQRRKGRKGL